MRNKYAVVALLIAVFCWSTVPVFLKYFTPYLDAWTVNGFRYAVVVILQLPLIFKFFRDGKYSRKIWKLALIPAVLNFFQQVLWAWAPYFIDAGRIGFLVRSSVIWSIAGSFILFTDERFLLKDKRFWAGLFFSVIGFMGLSYYGNQVSLAGSFLGVLFVLSSSMFMAFYGLAVKRYFNDTDALVSFSVIALYTGLGIIGVMFAFGKPFMFFQIPLQISALVLLSGLIGINVAHVLFYVALRHLGVMISYSVSLMSAFFTALLSILFLGEQLNLMQWFTGTLIVLGGYLVILARNRKNLNH